MQSTLPALVFPFLSLVLLPGCELLADPVAPTTEDMPCETDADCAIPSLANRSSCGARKMARGSVVTTMETAACGPIPTMASTAPEPSLGCFRGTCSAVGSR